MHEVEYKNESILGEGEYAKWNDFGLKFKPHDALDEAIEPGVLEAPE